MYNQTVFNCVFYVHISRKTRNRKDLQEVCTQYRPLTSIYMYIPDLSSRSGEGAGEQ
jgi:hypothetical protein